MRKHPKLLKEAGISPPRYAELMAVCQQYRADRRALANIRAGIVDRPERSGKWRQPDPTGNAAVAIADATRFLSGRVDAIESAAAAVADRAVARAILRNVTEGRDYYVLRPPIGRAQFYRRRLLFFIELDRRMRRAGAD